MSNSINISHLEEDASEAMVSLVNSAFRGESSKIGWTTEADLLGGLRTNLKSIQDLVKKPGAVILAAKNETNRLVGCVYLEQQKKKLYLGMLTVAPDLQAKGIGNQLLMAAEKYATEIDCNTITMTVIDIRYELIDWYLRKGYHRTGETKPFPTDPQFGLPKQPLQFTVLEKKLLL